ncbi:hypothetical protein ACFU99_09295 [Streptomyces sp. NPDC057654]|uniref:hypothetical protein n=1 Tax=Streptomyces sp. NPDC057654 TaxID=3346196 RepID=UPI0036916773
MTPEALWAQATWAKGHCHRCGDAESEVADTGEDIGPWGGDRLPLHACRICYFLIWQSLWSHPLLTLHAPAAPTPATTGLARLRRVRLQEHPS